MPPKTGKQDGTSNERPKCNGQYEDHSLLGTHGWQISLKSEKLTQLTRFVSKIMKSKDWVNTIKGVVFLRLHVERKIFGIGR